MSVLWTYLYGKLFLVNQYLVKVKLGKESKDDVYGHILIELHGDTVTEEVQLGDG